ncbi:extracellular glycoprotein lacritin [Molossus molossus]|uniref:Lacritin n=1 Tax=Molossus molossus TaxID=27622 RepID=A0A7J8FZ10_MOLMO|nr:extracellular glycoprotein lacritin [Molossus molossus]KAF6452725.1 lacritin [Molossus molossus]
MRFTALLPLAALAGALVCAQNTTADHTQAAEDPPSSELKITASAKSALLQETTTAAQKISTAAQEPARPALWKQGLNPLKSAIEKGLSIAGKAFEGVEKRVRERIQDGKQLVEGGTDFAQRLKDKLDLRNFWVLRR